MKCEHVLSGVAIATITVVKVVVVSHVGCDMRYCIATAGQDVTLVFQYYYTHGGFHVIFLVHSC